MVNDFAAKLQQMAKDGILTCVRIIKFARNNDIKLHNIRLLLKAARIHLKDCGQTCISYRCKNFKQEETVKK